MSYSFFANVYDTLTFNVEYDERAEYICSLFSSFGINGGLMLDLACGTGSLSQLIAKRGFDMVLVDSSSEMLSFAKERLPDSLILCQDMRELDLYGTVNAAVCSLDGINHLLKPCDVKKTFERLSLFIEKGGMFVFDINTRYKHLNTLADNTFVYEKDNVYLVWQNRLKKKNCTVDITLDIFVKDGEMYSKHSESFSERAYPIEDICGMLEETGFTVKGIYDDMSFLPPIEASERVYIAAMKN